MPFILTVVNKDGLRVGTETPGRDAITKTELATIRELIANGSATVWGGVRLTLEFKPPGVGMLAFGHEELGVWLPKAKECHVVAATVASTPPQDDAFGHRLVSDLLRPAVLLIFMQGKEYGHPDMSATAAAVINALREKEPG